MDTSFVEKIADAVLYEGYLLYPYRPSSLKNRMRWTFGVVSPRRDSQASNVSEHSFMQTECLVVGSDRTAIDVKVRFLQVIARRVGEFCGKLEHGCEVTSSDAAAFREVDSLRVGDETYYTWQEAEPREVTAILKLVDLLDRPHKQQFAFVSNRHVRTLRDPAGNAGGVLIREQCHLEGQMTTSAERCDDELFKLTVRVQNHTPIDQPAASDRDELILRSLVSTHTILRVLRGNFISLLDPPAPFAAAAGACRNIGTWPVLAGEPGTHDVMLSSPIVLYDYPQIAPQSPGDFFDATEIDEILALRVTTLTDQEQREAHAADPRVHALLTRTNSLTPEQRLKLHGVTRCSPTVPKTSGRERKRTFARTVSMFSLETGCDCARAAGADAFDLFLDGKTATVESVEQTLEQEIFLAVSVDEDPGQGLNVATMPGHRFFFRPEEVEPLTDESRRL